jgi:folate-binding protein YgfZ
MTRTSDTRWRVRRAVDVVALKGPDARRFANGMFTNNVRDLPVGAHQFSAMTDDRGRLQGLMDLVCVEQDRFVLALEGMTAEAFEATYGMFIVFDDVELSRPDASLHVVQGGPATLGWPSPRVAGAREVLVEGQLPDWLAELPELPADALDAERIAAGWPRFPDDASDKQLPHELNLRDTHLHFEKGCYRGQETIHRVDVMGQVRKGLVGLQLAEVLPVGAPVRVDGQEVGRLGSSAVHEHFGPIGLAVMRNTHGPGTEVEVDGRPGRVCALPFDRSPDGAGESRRS